MTIVGPSGDCVRLLCVRVKLSLPGWPLEIVSVDTFKEDTSTDSEKESIKLPLFKSSWLDSTSGDLESLVILPTCKAFISGIGSTLLPLLSTMASESTNI